MIHGDSDVFRHFHCRIPFLPKETWFKFGLRSIWTFSHIKSLFILLQFSERKLIIMQLLYLYIITNFASVQYAEVSTVLRFVSGESNNSFVLYLSAAVSRRFWLEEHISKSRFFNQILSKHFTAASSSCKQKLFNSVFSLKNTCWQIRRKLNWRIIIRWNARWN